MENVRGTDFSLQRLQRRIPNSKHEIVTPTKEFVFQKIRSKCFEYFFNYAMKKEKLQTKRQPKVEIGSHNIKHAFYCFDEELKILKFILIFIF